MPPTSGIKRVPSLVAVRAAQTLLHARRAEGNQIDVIHNLLSSVLPRALSVRAATGIYMAVGAAPRVPPYPALLAKTYRAEAGAGIHTQKYTSRTINAQRP